MASPKSNPAQVLDCPADQWSAPRKPVGISITPFAAEHVAAVQAFNGRLRAASTPLLFPETHLSDTLPKLSGRTIFDEYFLAVDGDAVHGAYILKQQPFFVAGGDTTLGQYRLPLSEGQLDKKYAAVGVQMYLDAVRRLPRLYTIGLGGYEEAFTQMLVKAGWKTWTVPFYFRVLHPRRFLRHIEYLRTSPLRRTVLNMLAFSGLGTLAVGAFQAIKTRGQRASLSGIETFVESGFGPWADELWQSARGEYSLIARRDAEQLNILYSPSEPRWTRLRVTRAGQTIGWAVVLNVPMTGHSYFGDMQVGSLIDCLAMPSCENQVAAAAVDYLRKERADIVVTNLAHKRWRAAVEAAGLFQGPSNYIFAASKPVAALLEPFDEQVERIHMTRGDGAGAGNLIEVRK